MIMMLLHLGMQSGNFRLLSFWVHGNMLGMRYHLVSTDVVMKQSYLLIVGLLMLSCNYGTEIIEIKDKNGQITESYQINSKTEKKEGTYQRFNDGILAEQAEYKSDTLHGVRTLFYDDGAKEIEESYLMGVFHGPFKSYYSEGIVKLEGLYENGTMESTWTKYYPTGQVMERVEMHLNNENGPFVEYYENGNLKAKGSYLDGDNEHGELLLYDNSGILERKMQCDKGICHTTWSKEMESDEE